MTKPEITEILTTAILDKLGLPTDTPMSSIVLEDDAQTVEEIADELTTCLDFEPKGLIIDMRGHFEAQAALNAKLAGGHQVVDAALPAEMRITRSRPTVTIEDGRLAA